MNDDGPRQRYIDGVGEVRIHEDMVRMDLLSMSPTQRNQDGEVVPEFVQQLVMSPRAFMRMVRVLGETIQTMEDKGVISMPNTGTSVPDAATAPAPATKRKSASGSPNFG